MSLTLGRHSYICEPYHLRGNDNTISIGSYSSIATNCIFDCGFNHNYKNVTNFPLHKLDGRLPGNILPAKDIIIGSDVWIGENAVIMNGVFIGHGAVIGINTVVTKDVAPYEVVAGHKRWMRFNPEQVVALLNIAWWEWTDERVLANAGLLLSEDIDSFIRNHQ